jgi:small subunit ribosomal protein S17
MSDETNPTETNPIEPDATDASATDVKTTDTTATDTTVTSATATKATATNATATDTEQSRSNPRKVREGIVVSDKMDSTLVVAVNERVSHARYGKTVQRTKKLYVHDEKNEAKLGDRVRVQETRPLSKLKRWRLTEVVERAR